jgi:hypothetical protein
MKADNLCQAGVPTTNLSPQRPDDDAASYKMAKRHDAERIVAAATSSCWSLFNTRSIFRNKGAEQSRGRQAPGAAEWTVTVTYHDVINERLR